VSPPPPPPPPPPLVGFQVVGEADLLSLAHTCPRIFKLDYKTMIVPKVRVLTRLLPLQDEASLLRSAPHAFFYSTTVIQDKMNLLAQVLPSINVTTMVGYAPSLLSLDIARNISPKVRTRIGLGSMMSVRQTDRQTGQFLC